MIDRVLGNYKILEKIGEGGMGEVFRGLDLMLEREVAIKSLRPELVTRKDILERFRSEAVALAKLNHPNIATLYTFFQEAGEFFMVMEFVQGELLGDRILRYGHLQWQMASKLMLQALEGLQHAHSHGIVHRDIKPSNIMVKGNDDVKLMDFGIARILGQSRLTRTGHLIGTLEYMSPEQIQGRETDARSDLYSLGIVFYESLTGHIPFEKKSDYDLIKSQVEETPQSPRTLASGISSELETVILRALAKNPQDRFQTTEQMRTALWEIPNLAIPGFQPVGELLPETRLYTAGKATTTVHEKAEDDQGKGITETRVKWKWKDYPGVIALLLLIGISLVIVFFPKPPDIIGPPKTQQGETFKVDIVEQSSRMPEQKAPPTVAQIGNEQKPGTDSKPAPESEPEPEPEPEPTRQKAPQPNTLETMLNSGDRAIQALRLTSPRENSAVYYYQQALKLDPGNAHAQQGMNDIVSKYILLAETAWRKGKYDQTKMYLQRASTINPQSTNLLAARKRLASPQKTYIPSQKTNIHPTPVTKKANYQSIRAAKAGYRNGEITKQEYSQITRKLKTQYKEKIKNLKLQYRDGKITKIEYKQRVRKAKSEYKG